MKRPAALFAAFFFACPIFAGRLPTLDAAEEQAALLSLADIRRLCRDHVPADQTIDKAAEQGIDFEVTPAVADELRQWKFRPEQIEALKTCPAEPLVAGKGVPMSEAQRDKALAEIRSINALSQLGLVPIRSRHFTLWGAKGVAAERLPTVEKLEKFYHRKFREPVRSGLDPRSAHLIYLKTRGDYAKWIRAMLKTIGERFEEKDNPGRNQEFREKVVKGPALYYGMFSAICLEDNSLESEHRCTGLSVGYMYFMQLAWPPKSGPLTTGLANATEAVAAGSPRAMIANTAYHEERRELGSDTRSWNLLVRSRILKKTVTPPDKLLALDTYQMVQGHYAEAWSLTTFLCKQPDRYGKLLLAIRGRKSELEAIEEVYGWDEEQLTQRWHTYAMGQK